MTEATLSAKVTADIADFTKKFDTMRGSIDQLAGAGGAASGKTAAAVESATGGATKLTAVTGTLSAAAAATASLAVMAAREAGRYAESLQQLSQKTGISTTKLQELAPLFQQQNVPLEKLIPAVKSLAKHYVDAAAGSDKAAEKFAALGMATAELGQLKDPADLLRAIADRVAAMPDPLQRTAAMTRLMGKSALDLLPVMSGAAAGFDASARAARDMGAVLSTDTLNALAALDDQFDKTAGLTDTVSRKFGTAFAPAVGLVTEGINNILQAVSAGLDWLITHTSDGARQVAGVFVGAFAVGGPIVLAATGLAALLGVALAPILIGGAIVVGLAAAAIAIAAKWDWLKQTGAAIWTGVQTSIVGSAQAIYAGVVEWLVTKTSAIAAKVQGVAESFAHPFEWLKDHLVTHSVIPDMVDDIGRHMQLLDVAMTAPARTATAATGRIIEGAVLTWQSAINQFVSTINFGWGSVTQTVGQNLAQMTTETVNWAAVGTQLGQQFLGNMINVALQLLTQWLLTFTGIQAAHTALETAKTAETTIGETARLGIHLATNKAIAVSTIASLGGMAAVGQGAILVMGVVMESAAAMMAAIAASLTAGIVTAPLAVPVAAGAATLAASGVAGVAAATGALQAALGTAIVGASVGLGFAQGGISFGPAVFAEAGPEAAIPLNARGASFMQDAFGFDRQSARPTTIIVELDGAPIMKHVANRLPSMLRLKGLPA